MVLTNNSKGVDVKFDRKKLPGEGGFKMEFVCRRVHRAYLHSSAAWRCWVNDLANISRNCEPGTASCVKSNTHMGISGAAFVSFLV